MADWDADDFEPDVPATVSVPKVTDKWDGEDEDDDVKVKSLFLFQSFGVESVLFGINWLSPWGEYAFFVCSIVAVLYLSNDT